MESIRTQSLVGTTASRCTAETDMPIGQQRISHPVASFGLRMGLGEKNTAQTVDEMARKEGLSLEFLYLREMPRLRGSGRSRVRTFLRPSNSLLIGKNTGNFIPKIAPSQWQMPHMLRLNGKKARLKTNRNRELTG